MSEILRLPDKPSVDERAASSPLEVQIALPEQIEPTSHEVYAHELTPEKSPFQNLLFSLRERGIKASTSEWLDLQQTLETGTVESIKDFYLVSRSLLVKDVSKFAAFNRVFNELMAGYITSPEEEAGLGEKEELEEKTEPEETKPEEESEEKEPSASDKYEQKEQEGIKEVTPSDGQTSEATHGGKEATKDIPNSPNAANNGQNKQNHGAEIERFQNSKETRSLKEQLRSSEIKEQLRSREIKELDRESPLSREQMGIAFAKLTAIIRDDSETPSRKLDAKKTVRQIAKSGGIPRLSWEDSIEVKPKMMILFDVGGSTDEYRGMVEELFTAAKDYIDELSIYYFHNAPYGKVWPQSDGNWPKNLIPVEHILDKDPSTNVIIIGDAWMAWEELWKCFSPSETPGMDTLKLIAKTYENNVWLNPIFANEYDAWDGSGTISDLEAEFDMYDLNLDGLEKAITQLIENNRFLH